MMSRNIRYVCKRCGYTWSGYVETKYCPRCYTKDIEKLRKGDQIIKKFKKMFKNIKKYKRKIKESWKEEEKDLLKEYIKEYTEEIFSILSFFILVSSLLVFIIYLIFNI